MDAHFGEYLAAVRAMHEIYGEQAEDFPTEFHGEAERHDRIGRPAVVRSTSQDGAPRPHRRGGRHRPAVMQNR